MTVKPNFVLEAAVEGRYIVERFKGGEDGLPYGECLERLEFKNIITNTGMGKIYLCGHDGFGIGYVFSACVVGTGNTAVAKTDTSLAVWLATADNGQYQPSATYVAGSPSPAYWKLVGGYQFATGVAAGNIAEIGIYSYGASKTALTSRALILDTSGNPTTITVQSDEVLNVTYEFRVYIQTTDISSTFVSDGVTYNTVLRPSNINSPGGIANDMSTQVASCWAYSGALGAITAAPAGSSISKNSGFSNYLLSGDTAQVDTSFLFGVNDANYTNGIQAFNFTTKYHQFQMSFIDPLTSKGIPKVSGQQMIVAARFLWTRL
jgi:hypothetical protein